MTRKTPPRLDVLCVVSECAPFAKTGGLADVAGALPAALAPHGVRIRVLMPAYPGLAAGFGVSEAVLELPMLFGGPVQVLAGTAAGVEVLLLDAPHLFDRAGGLYTGPDGADWPDNDLRYGALCQVAARVGRAGLGDGWRPEVIHAHDWQAGLVPLYLGRRAPRPATLFTIHNMAFQGVFLPGSVARLGLDEAAFAPDGVEYWGNLSTLKAGLVYADAISTVSETYARELREPAFGLGLEGVIAARAEVMHGIVNGIDLGAWDPAADPAIAPFGADGLDARAANRARLAESFGISAPSGPLIGVVSRLTEQKGLDLLLAALPAVRAADGALVVLGTGAPEIEAALERAARERPGLVAARIAYDDALARLIYAGSDIVAVPSRFEPCGLTQLYALRYGAVPLVARTGGLADTVIDANPAALAAGVATGFMCSPDQSDSLAEAISRAAGVFRDRAAWRRMQSNAMAQPVGWDASAARYAALYRMLAAQS